MSGLPSIPVAIQEHCDGPHDAWLLPRLQMRLRPAAAAIDVPRAKLGGQPVWLGPPTWPLSRSLGIPMMFVGQIPVPGEPTSLAYLFVTDDPQGTTETFDAEAGENALLVQPAGRIPPFIVTIGTATGPSLWRRGMTWDERVGVELAVDLVPPDPAAEATLDAEIAAQEAERTGVSLDIPDAADADDSALPPYSYVGGKVHLWQVDLQGIPADWRFHFQLDGGEGHGPDDTTPSTSAEGPDTASSLRTSAKAASYGTASDRDPPSPASSPPQRDSQPVRHQRRCRRAS
ncbi:hypothetical protein O7605_02055 [Verrucosispora sp. WMMA2121]|uniref:hypothetical protein n=1 Tax=Verrucosispora sp. WMMA2121 TaxID=3015164 RepID=UPI0022B5EB09|nr:hypothetical protein [Verrucosispora sp. WMMA2121]MCZ7418310.1 hypothetical protein [Verrucosispora sp. WMMA2121]